MPDHEELESMLDEMDTRRRLDRLMPWRDIMQPSPEADEADEDEGGS